MSAAVRITENSRPVVSKNNSPEDTVQYSTVQYCSTDLSMAQAIVLPLYGYLTFEMTVLVQVEELVATTYSHATLTTYGIKGHTLNRRFTRQAING